MGARFCAIMSLGDRITGRYDRALSAAFRSYLRISFSLWVSAEPGPEPPNFATASESRVITRIYPLGVAFFLLYSSLLSKLLPTRGAPLYPPSTFHVCFVPSGPMTTRAVFRPLRIMGAAKGCWMLGNCLTFNA